MLRTLNDSPQIPWVVIGDFNEIAYSTEKKGGLPRRERQMCRFGEVMDDCSLTDIGFSGQWFTWEKGRLRANDIRERLDKGITNHPWWDLFLNFKLSHLTHAFSDHCPLLLNSNFETQHSKQWQFRFEASWLLEDSCEEEVKRI